MKKIIGVLLVLCLLVPCVSVFAENDITVLVDGNKVEFDQPPIIENDRTLVPMRAIFEVLGSSVNYYDYGESKTVYASRGLKSVFFEIGSDEMYIDGDAVTIDVPAKIVNSRTLVPLRAVSEALDTVVEWIESDRAVIIESRQGAHKIERREISYKDEGNVDLEVYATYPEIESDGNEFIDKINEEYKNEAEAVVENAIAFYNDYLKSDEVYEEFKMAYTFDLDYEVTLDRNGYLSILSYYSSYTGGAHPNSTMAGRVFDLRENKELYLRDLFNEETFDLDNAVAERIEEKVLEYSDEEHAKSVHDAALEDIDNAGYYLTDNAVHVFYVPYQIASYAEGYLTADIYYDSEYINVDLRDYDRPELEYEIEENRTTGYEWSLTQGSDKLDIELEHYTDPNKVMPGAGGVYKMRVKGIKPGNATVKFEYKRGWEELPIQELEYRFYVEKDLGVTLIDVK